MKKHGENFDNLSTTKYINKIENRIMLKIKTGSFLEFLKAETMKLIGCTENKIKIKMVKL